MKYDLFDVTSPGMTLWQRAWRIAFFIGTVSIMALDLFVWRP